MPRSCGATSPDRRCCMIPEVHWGLLPHRGAGARAHPRHADRRHRAPARSARGLARRLAENGVEIFFTQVFRRQLLPRPTCTPGNIFVLMENRRSRALGRRGLRHRGHARPARSALSCGELSSRCSIATTVASRPCTCNPAGCHRIRASTRWNRRCARSAADLRSTPQGDLLRQPCCCACSRRCVASMGRFSHSCCCCRRRC